MPQNAQYAQRNSETSFGFAEDPESPATATPVSPVETSRSLGRAIKEDAPPFMFAGAIIMGATALYRSVFGKKPRAHRVGKVIRRLARR